MKRLVGWLLMIAGIWLGLSIYGKGVDRTLAGLLGSEPAAPTIEAEAQESATPNRERAAGSGRAAPSAITSRVRERVNGAIAEGTRRHGGD